MFKKFTLGAAAAFTAATLATSRCHHQPCGVQPAPHLPNAERQARSRSGLALFQDHCFCPADHRRRADHRLQPGLYRALRDRQGHGYLHLLPRVRPSRVLGHTKPRRRHANYNREQKRRELAADCYAIREMWNRRLLTRKRFATILRDLAKLSEDPEHPSGRVRGSGGGPVPEELRTPRPAALRWQQLAAGQSLPPVVQVHPTMHQGRSGNGPPQFLCGAAESRRRSAAGMHPPDG